MYNNLLNNIILILIFIVFGSCRVGLTQQSNRRGSLALRQLLCRVFFRATMRQAVQVMWIWIVDAHNRDKLASQLWIWILSSSIKLESIQLVIGQGYICPKKNVKWQKYLW
jgi:hypothetical protein